MLEVAVDEDLRQAGLKTFQQTRCSLVSRLDLASISFMAISAASPRPTHSGAGSVPERKPRSCPHRRSTAPDEPGLASNI